MSQSGKAVKDEIALIEANTGQPLTEEWLHEFRGRRNEALVEGLLPIRGAVEAAAQSHVRYEGRIACATVFGYSPPEAGHDTPESLRAAGASLIFIDMAELPVLMMA